MKGRAEDFIPVRVRYLTMRFTHDRRGQSVVIGTVILFGFLILALSLYQVQVVPQQNSQVEFQHFGEVQNDLVDARSGILTTGQANTPQFKSVKLGTTYPYRLFAINPPAPAGTLQTSGAHPIIITNGSTTVTVSSRFLQYRPGYNELLRSPTWYDNSVLYLDERDTVGKFVVIEDQELIDNGTVRLSIIQNEYRRSGTQRVGLELYPTDTENVTKMPTGELNITVPTRLNGTEYWDDEVGDEQIYRGVSTDEYEDGIHGLNITANSDRVKINTVGLGNAPDGGAQDNIRSPDSGSGQTGEGTPDSEISMRIDDLTDTNPGSPRFYVSYAYSGSFDEMRISADSTTSTAGDTVSSTDRRNGVSLSDSFGGGEEFSVTVRAIENGSTVAQRTVFLDADTQNPAENDDLSRSDSSNLVSSDIRDTSNSGQGPRYAFDYTTSTGSFSAVQLHVLNKNGNGGSDSLTRAQPSGNNVQVSTGFGLNEPYKVAILVVDADGVVVDDRISDDVADDGTDPS